MQNLHALLYFQPGYTEKIKYYSQKFRNLGELITNLQQYNKVIFLMVFMASQMLEINIFCGPMALVIYWVPSFCSAIYIAKNPYDTVQDNIYEVHLPFKFNS